MLKAICAICAVVMLTACTPRTILQNPTTGQVADCSGSGAAWMVGGLIAMSIEHNKCVEQYKAFGFKAAEVQAGQ